MKTTIALNVNEETHAIEADPETRLLYVLRNNLELNGPKFGCGLGQCGACMVLMDGNAVFSCQLPIRAIGERKITTLEGLAKNGALHKIQQAFIDEQAAQCGYCLNGMIMAAVSLLNHNPDPEDSEIKSAMQTNICRCGVYPRVINAIKRAATN